MVRLGGWLRRAGGPALIPVVGLVACLVLIPFAAGRTDRTGPAAPVAESAPRAPLTLGPPEAAPVSRCLDNGTSGKRVLALYVRGDGQKNRFPVYQKRFRKWLDRMDGDFVYSARINGGGWRKIRWVRDQDCAQVIDAVEIPQASMESTDTITAALKTLGYDRPDRKYIVWYDAPGCGVGFGVGGNDVPDWYNLYNYGPHYAAIGTSCWGWAPTLHELLHTLGGVNESAPHGTKNGHCWDDEDILCSDDKSLPAGGLRKICKLPAGAPKGGFAENLIDCNGDDYFNTDPAPGSYLDTHWNIADSEFLYSEKPATQVSPVVPAAEPAPKKAKKFKKGMKAGTGQNQPKRRTQSAASAD